MIRCLAVIMLKILNPLQMNNNYYPYYLNYSQSAYVNYNYFI